MELQLNAYSTQGLTRFPARGLLMGEASTLGLRPGHQWDQLYDDACDVGIPLRSHKTGVVSTWFLLETITQNGEVLGWMLKPTHETIRRQPQLAEYQLNISND